MKNLKQLIEKSKFTFYGVTIILMSNALFIQDIFAQGPPPPPTPTPINGGVVALVVGAIGYGAKKLYGSKSQ